MDFTLGRGKEFEWGKVELEQVHSPARRPDKKLIVLYYELNTRYKPGPNLSQARRLFNRLEGAQDNVINTRLE